MVAPRISGVISRSRVQPEAASIRKLPAASPLKLRRVRRQHHVQRAGQQPGVKLPRHHQPVAAVVALPAQESPIPVRGQRVERSAEGTRPRACRRFPSESGRESPIPCCAGPPRASGPPSGPSLRPTFSPGASASILFEAVQLGALAHDDQVVAAMNHGIGGGLNIIWPACFRMAKDDDAQVAPDAGLLQGLGSHSQPSLPGPARWKRSGLRSGGEVQELGHVRPQQGLGQPRAGDARKGCGPRRRPPAELLLGLLFGARARDVQKLVSGSWPRAPGRGCSASVARAATSPRPARRPRRAAPSRAWRRREPPACPSGWRAPPGARPLSITTKETPARSSSSAAPCPTRRIRTR